MDEGEDSSCDADVHKELAKMAAVIGVGRTEEVCVAVNVANTVGDEEDSNNCDGDEEEDCDGDDDDCDDEAKDEGKEDDHNGEEDLDEDENINDDEDEKVDKGEGNDDRDEGNKGVDDDDHIECADRSFVTWEVNNLDKLVDVEV